MRTELLAVCLELGFHRALCDSPGSLTLSPHPPTHALGLITPTASFWAYQPGSHAPGPGLETGLRDRHPGIREEPGCRSHSGGPRTSLGHPWKSREGAAGVRGDVWTGAGGSSSLSCCPASSGCPGHRSPEPLCSWGGQPSGPAPHLRLVPTQTGRPTTAILGGEAGQRDHGEGASDCRPGAAGLPEWEVLQRSAAGPDLGLTRASPSLPCPVLLPREPQASDAERLRFGRAPRGRRHKRSRMQLPDRGLFAIIALRVRKSEWTLLG